jgi:hypothetical protein
MTDKITVFTRATVPAELAQEWLQHLRDFDVAHNGCHFEVMADTPEMTVVNMVAMMKVEPGLTFSKVFDRAPPVVHILNHGLPLCRFTRDMPLHWPPGHKWVGDEERSEATCAGCIAIKVVHAL